MTLRKSVETLFPQYTVSLESSTTFLYSDVVGLVTCAQGILADPVERALSLEWHIGDRRATEAEVRNDWNTIKSRAMAMTAADRRKWTARMQAPLTSCRMTQDFIDALTVKRLRGNYDYIVKHLIPNLGDAPADGQMGLLSLSWAVGAGFDKTNPPRTAVVEAANAGDWLAVGAAARLREAGNPGVIERNRHQDLMFANAATVTRRGLDPAALWWPNKCPVDDSLKTLAIKALDLGLAKASLPPEKE